MTELPLHRDVLSVAPIPITAYLAAWAETYSSLILLTVGLLYAGFQFYWRRKEHNHRMKQ